MSQPTLKPNRGKNPIPKIKELFDYLPKLSAERHEVESWHRDLAAMTVSAYEWAEADGLESLALLKIWKSIIVTKVQPEVASWFETRVESEVAAKLSEETLKKLLENLLTSFLKEWAADRTVIFSLFLTLSQGSDSVGTFANRLRELSKPLKLELSEVRTRFIQGLQSPSQRQHDESGC